MHVIRRSGSGRCCRLPEGGDAVHIWVIWMQSRTGKTFRVKVSDISDNESPKAGVTRTVKEMEKKGYLSKIASPDDGRVSYISITEEG